MSPITTHILDLSSGCPAAGVAVELSFQEDSEWLRVGHGITNADGRQANLLSPGQLQPGRYRLLFETAAYFRSQGKPTFHPWVEIVFEVIDPAQHYHVPLLLSPFGYSTYRGS